MTDAEMARLYALAMQGARPWSAAEIADLRCAHGAIEAQAHRGFALGRVVAGDAEILTIAVHPDVQGRGTGTALVRSLGTEARAMGAEAMFLEVAEDNAPARALYIRAGYREIGRRRGYYDGTDALVMRLEIEPPQNAAPPGQ